MFTLTQLDLEVHSNVKLWVSETETFVIQASYLNKSKTYLNSRK